MGTFGSCRVCKSIQFCLAEKGRSTSRSSSFYRTCLQVVKDVLIPLEGFVLLLLVFSEDSFVNLVVYVGM